MSIETFKGIKPKISKSAFVHESAVIIGDVSIGDNSSIWPNCVIRGDVQKVIIGNRTNVQDGSILHVTSDTKYCEGGIPLNIGNNVTIGHKVILHSCSVGNNSLIGMGSTVLNKAKIGNNCLVGANSLITEGKEFPDNSLIVGSPGTVKRELTDMEKKIIELSAFHYVENMKKFRNNLKIDNIE